MVDNSATGNLAIDQEKNTARTDSEQHVSGSQSNHFAGVSTMNLNHPNSSLPDTDAVGSVAQPPAVAIGDRADESQSNNMPTPNLASTVANNSLISGVNSVANSVAGNVANSPNLLGAAAATAAAVHNNSINSAPSASVINSTLNNSSIISQPPITPSIQSSSNLPSQAISSACSNQPLSNQPLSNQPLSNQPLSNQPLSNQPLASGHQLPATGAPANNPPSFLPINAASASTTINLNNAGLVNGNNSTINSNLPHLTAPVAASCPTAGNLIAQPPLPIASSAAMNTATSNSVANVDIQDDSEDESEILEESPCGRWLKRREEVEQRDIPGIDATFLAMDTEEGVEVVWNEVRFSERKYFNSKEETICEVFDRLILLNHPNIVKLHKYWIDKDAEKARIIFITEYMSSGSVKLFLKKTKKNEIKMSLGAWKRWCKQLLSALCYLHSSQPPIIHENLTCDTIFISHNGLIKMGAVAPNAIHQHIKTVADDSMSNIYLVAPEIMNLTDDISSVLTPAVDIYSFGMCALEMAALEITNGESTQITKETVEKTIESLDNELQKDFIRKCLAENPADRPSAKDLLFHPVIFEVPTLALLATHSILNNSPSCQLTDETFQRTFTNLDDDAVLAEIVHPDGRPGVVRRISDLPRTEMEKYFEEVRNGAYPLTAIFPTTKQPIISRQTTISPEPSGSGNEPKSAAPPEYNEENRKIVNMMCNIKAPQENENLMMTLLLRLDDKMNRQLSCEITDIESPICLANELVYYGFINQSDRDMVAALINDTISRTQYTKSDTSASVTLHQAATSATTLPTTA